MSLRTTLDELATLGRPAAECRPAAVLLLGLLRRDLLDEAEDPEELPGVGAGQHGDDDHDQQADAAEAAGAAARHAHAPAVLDVAALLAALLRIGASGSIWGGERGQPARPAFPSISTAGSLRTPPGARA